MSLTTKMVGQMMMMMMMACASGFVQFTGEYNLDYCDGEGKCDCYEAGYDWIVEACYYDEIWYEYVSEFCTETNEATCLSVGKTEPLTSCEYHDEGPNGAGWYDGVCDADTGLATVHFFTDDSCTGEGTYVGDFGGWNWYQESCDSRRRLSALTSKLFASSS